MCGIFVNPAAFAILGAILLVGVLGTVWPWVALRGITAEAEFVQTRCRVGQSVLLRLRISNRLPWPAWGLSVRRGFLDSRSESAGVALARVNGWSETEFEWMYSPERRGVFPQGVPQLDTGFPFGLVHASAPIRMTNELVVWPFAVPLDAMPDAAEIQTREDQLTDRRTGSCGDRIGIRPFREGDSLRHVHWLQTARTGRLIVAERQSPASCAIRLVVDVDQRAHSTSCRACSLEQTLSLAASVLESMHRHHALVELSLHDQRVIVGESQADLRRGLDLLARIPQGGLPNQGCRLDRPSRTLPTIAVTTDRALAHHRGHRHASSGERYIVVRTENEPSNTSPHPGCTCHSWLEVAAGDVLSDVLPPRWRRACHAA